MTWKKLKLKRTSVVVVERLKAVECRRSRVRNGKTNGFHLDMTIECVSNEFFLIRVLTQLL